jgi:hypothetical protein
MAQNVVKDSANWASIWVKEVNLGATPASLPGGSVAAAIGKITQVGAKVGVVLDTPVLRADGNYWATVDMAALVRISGMSGTGTDGQTVLKAAGIAGAPTLTVGNNIPIGFLDRPKVATGDDAWVQLVPGTAIVQAV